MLKEMDLDSAYCAIQAFAQANQIDELTAIEYMVKYYAQLSIREHLALGVFMAETRRGWQEIQLIIQCSLVVNYNRSFYKGNTAHVRI